MFDGTTGCAYVEKLLRILGRHGIDPAAEEIAAGPCSECGTTQLAYTEQNVDRVRDGWPPLVILECKPCGGTITEYKTTEEAVEGEQ